MNTFDLMELYNNLTNARLKVEKELTERLTVEQLYDSGLHFAAILKVRKLNPRWSLTECKKFVEDTYS